MRALIRSKFTTSLKGSTSLMAGLEISALFNYYAHDLSGQYHGLVLTLLTFKWRLHLECVNQSSVGIKHSEIYLDTVG